MKYLIILVMVLLGFSSCQKEKKSYYVKYVVIYPTNNDTISGVYKLTSPPYIRSYRGTNRLTSDGSFIYETSAPIKLVEYREVK